MATVVLKPEHKGHGNLGLGLLALMFLDTDFRNLTTCERRQGAHAYVGVPAESPDGSVADSLHGPLDL